MRSISWWSSGAGRPWRHSRRGRSEAAAIGARHERAVPPPRQGRRNRGRPAATHPTSRALPDLAVLPSASAGRPRRCRAAGAWSTKQSPRAHRPAPGRDARGRGSAPGTDRLRAKPVRRSCYMIGQRPTTGRPARASPALKAFGRLRCKRPPGVRRLCTQAASRSGGCALRRLCTWLWPSSPRSASVRCPCPEWSSGHWYI